MLLDAALSVVLGLLFPKMETRWLREVLRVALPAAVSVVKTLEARDIPNAQKLEGAARQIADVLDVGFGALPEWRDLDDLARARIVNGLVELALFIYRVSDGPGGGKAARQATRAVRNAAR